MRSDPSKNVTPQSDAPPDSFHCYQQKVNKQSKIFGKHAAPNIKQTIAAHLEPRALTGPGLLLDGHDLEHLVLERRANEEVDNLELLDRQGEQVDLLQGDDLAVAHQPPELRHRDPFLGVLLAATAAPPATTAPTAAAARSAPIAATRAEASAKSSTCGWSSVRHAEIFRGNVLREVAD